MPINPQSTYNARHFTLPSCLLPMTDSVETAGNSMAVFDVTTFVLHPGLVLGGTLQCSDNYMNSFYFQLC